jgi:hypothetical protein
MIDRVDEMRVCEECTFDSCENCAWLRNEGRWAEKWQANFVEKTCAFDEYRSYVVKSWERA